MAMPAIVFDSWDSHLGGNLKKCLNEPSLFLAFETDHSVNACMLHIADSEGLKSRIVATLSFEYETYPQPKPHCFSHGFSVTQLKHRIERHVGFLKQVLDGSTRSRRCFAQYSG